MMNTQETGIVVTITTGVKRTKLKAKYNLNTYDDYLKATRDMLNFFECSVGRLYFEDTQLLQDDNLNITFKTLKQPKIFR